MKKVIFISGQISSGKDTLSLGLVKHFTERKAIRLAYADELKKVATSILEYR